MRKLTKEEIEKLVRSELSGLIEAKKSSCPSGNRGPQSTPKDPAARGRPEELEEQDETMIDASLDELPGTGDEPAPPPPVEDLEGTGEEPVVIPPAEMKEPVDIPPAEMNDLEDLAEQAENPFKRLCEVALKPYGSYRGDKQWN